MLLTRLFEKLVKTGALTVIDAHGDRREFCGAPGPEATIRLHDASLHRKLVCDPALYLGEAYMDGALTIERGNVYDLLDIATRNVMDFRSPSFMVFMEKMRRLGVQFLQHNPLHKAKDHIAHHYDLSGKLYDLFLDSDRQYSCAYFTNPNDSLETAQRNKKRHIAAKLRLDRPGARVLDIGCGWGGLALYLARETGAHVTGITLSEEQLKVARERAAHAGLADRVSFHLRDYRVETGRYDRIVSVGMFEHVGQPYYPVFFERINDLLAPDGIALLHSIGRADGPGATNPWIQKYIFPGGYSPALSEVLPVIESKRLFVTDIEILRLHYAETLKAWRANFAANRDQVRALYDERFCRMWEFYLAGSELSFRNQWSMVFQIQMSRDINAVPLTRDYITDWERARDGRARDGRTRSAARGDDRAA